MFAKLVVFAAVAVAVMGQADRYPAGVHPAACPNYPLCDNAVLAHYQANPHQYIAPAAREYPAGVHPSTCPNYPYCSTHVPATAHWAPAVQAYHHAPAVQAYHAPQPAAARYPAGVHPSTCPNYPYCH